MLAHRIWSKSRRREQSRKRRRVDNVAESLPNHQSVRSYGPIHNAINVHADDLSPVVERDVTHLASDPNAGVVKHEIQSAMLAGHAFNQTGDLTGARDVQLSRYDCSAARHSICCLFGSLQILVCRNHAGALSSEFLADSASDT